jgi:hypothetical protein
MVRSFMKIFVNKLFLLAIGLVISCQHCESGIDHNVKDWSQVVDFAKHNLPLTGQLIQQPDGYAYVKVDDDYVHKLFPMLHAEGYAKPPYFRRANSFGAHITVILKGENKTLSEAGQNYNFTLDKILKVSPKKGESYIILQVSAPDLENLREKYGLSKKLHGNEFHITLAKKVVQ